MVMICYDVFRVHSSAEELQFTTIGIKTQYYWRFIGDRHCDLGFFQRLPGIIIRVPSLNNMVFSDNHS